MRRQLGYGLPFGFSALLYIVLTDLHNYFVSYRFGPAQFALYSIGCFSPAVCGNHRRIGWAGVDFARQRTRKAGEDDARSLPSSPRACASWPQSIFRFNALLMVVGREFISFPFSPNQLPRQLAHLCHQSDNAVAVSDRTRRSDHSDRTPSIRFFLLKIRFPDDTWRS
jgi:hypothetical protein